MSNVTHCPTCAGRLHGFNVGSSLGPFQDVMICESCGLEWNNDGTPYKPPHSVPDPYGLVVIAFMFAFMVWFVFQVMW